MKTSVAHRRTCEIAIPNATDTPGVAVIRMEPATPGTHGLHFEGSESLQVAGYGIVVGDLCSNPLVGELVRETKVKLAPWQIAIVRAIIDTDDPADGSPAHATFAVTDTRDGKMVGGVTIVATTVLPGNTGVIIPKNPCPLEIDKGTYCVEVGADPSNRTGGSAIPGDRPRILVAPITNPTNSRLVGAAVYLEHLGSSGVSFDPLTWTVGTLEPGGTFWATWIVDARRSTPGAYDASIVVRDDKHEAIRLRSHYRIPARGHD